MTRMVTPAILAAAAIVAAPAQAGQEGGNGKHDGAAHRCAVHAVGFDASGTLVAQALAPAGIGRWSGTLTANVTRANHRAPAGRQTYILDAARVRSAAKARPGDRVKLHGRLTRVPAGCGSALSMEVDVLWVTYKATS
jgi:hypothetical protein